MINKISKIFTVLALALVLLMPLAVGAQLGSTDSGDPFGVGAVGQDVGLGSGDLRTTIGSIIKAALGFLGVVAIIIVLIGGFKYMTAGGSDEKVAEARKWIVSGIIGLAIILSAYAITSYVITQLSSATGAN